MIRVCMVDELPEGEARRLDTSPPIAVFHAEATYYAIEILVDEGVVVVPTEQGSAA